MFCSPGDAHEMSHSWFVEVEYKIPTTFTTHAEYTQMCDVKAQFAGFTFIISYRCDDNVGEW